MSFMKTEEEKPIEGVLVAPAPVLELDFDELFQMLMYKRPHGGATVDDWVKRFLIPLGVKIDKKVGNFWLTVGSQPGMPGASKTLFSSHVDTVHHAEGKQSICIDEDLKIIFKDDNSPLGADDGAGVWTMMNLIRAKVPGTYIFHCGEEKGGIGSRANAKAWPNVLKYYDRAIAFDRKAYTSVITHQACGRCCSDEFGNALAAAVGLDYKLDTGGSFTDTASYVKLIPECTNMSIGYEREHSSDEILDYGHLAEFIPALLKVEWEKLPVVRDPSKEETFGRYSGSKYDYKGPKKDDEDEDPVAKNDRLSKFVSDPVGKGRSKSMIAGLPELSTTDKKEPLSYEDLYELCWEVPEAMADILLTMGVTLKDVDEAYERVCTEYEEDTKELTSGMS